MTQSGFTEIPVARLLPNPERLFLQHGPITLIIEALGKPRQIIKAYAAATNRFGHILPELADQLDILRSPITMQNAHTPLTGVIASNMSAAASQMPTRFITPMAAVAGAVADEVLATMISHAKLTRASVNNGGDIAVYFAGPQSPPLSVGIVADLATGEIISKARLSHQDNIGGIATSGWQGRSHSLGIADAVTVFARTAGLADAAATIIANKINLHGHQNIDRRPACELSPDSDLGDRLVTIGVGPLTPHEIEQALTSGERRAQKLASRGQISAAFISLKGRHKIIASDHMQHRWLTNHPTTAPSSEIKFNERPAYA